MSFRIVPLKPDMADIFADYLSNLDFTHLAVKPLALAMGIEGDTKFRFEVILYFA